MKEEEVESIKKQINILRTNEQNKRGYVVDCICDQIIILLDKIFDIN